MASYLKGTPQSLAPTNSRSQVQNKKSSKVYIFGDGDVADDDEEVTEFEMRSRHKTPFKPNLNEEAKPDFLEIDILEGETLQAIALKYACNVSELKRLNNLIQDQEFFGLKTVRVPIVRHGILSESKDNLQSQGARPKTKTYENGAYAFSDSEERDYLYDDSESQHDLSDPETQMKVLKTLSIRENFSSQGKEARKFLRKMDEDLSKLKKSPRAERESLTEVISVLTNKSIRPLDRAVHNSKHNGADCGISWWSLLIFCLGICIVVPLLYLVYHYLLS